MSYYENNPQWPNPSPGPANQNNWEQPTPPPRAGASTGNNLQVTETRPSDSSLHLSAATGGPSPQDDYAFFYQFEDVARTLTARPSDVDRAYDNMPKGGKPYGMGGRRDYSSPGPKMGGGPGPGPGRKSMDYNSRMPGGPGPRPHSVNQFDDPRGPPNSNLQNFYATQRHQPSRGSNDAEQMMQAKRRMAAQRERELRNLHTEQQYQRNVVPDVTYTNNKAMTEEETRDLIARQRSALYGEGPFAEKGGYVDETGHVRTGVPSGPGNSGPSSLRGASPLNFDGPFRGQSPLTQDVRGNVPDSATPAGDQASRTGSTSSPQPNAANKNAFESAVNQAVARTSSSSPGGSPSGQEGPAGSKASQQGATVAPIGTRPSGASSASSKRSTTPLTSPGGWGRGNGVWGPQSSGLGAPSASVWG